MYSLHNGDCLPWLKSLESASVDCVFVDLPYFGIVDEAWDNQWKTREIYLDWVCLLAEQFKRITKSNSSIFLFCDEKMEAYIQVRLDEYFLLLNKIVWFKKNSLAKSATETFRSFAPTTERALFYSPSKDDIKNVFSFEIERARNEKGYSAKDVAEFGKFYGKVNHGGTVSNWEVGCSIPSPEQWKIMCSFLSINPDYESLLQNYKLSRRPFNADNKTFDVIEWANVSANDNTEHPTTKPLGLYRRILSVITEPNQVVLDCCMGSGTAGVVAVELGRSFLGCEIDPKYFSIAQARIKKAAQSPSFYTLPNKASTRQGRAVAQDELFG